MVAGLLLGRLAPGLNGALDAVKIGGIDTAPASVPGFVAAPARRGLGRVSEAG
jgi:hypothetical protein